MVDGNWIVGIAEYKATHSPNRLMAYGLGSCVGIVLYDQHTKIGGLAHIMLPSSRFYSQVALPGKFADTAIDALLSEMKKMGCRQEKLFSKIVGGANMFSSISQNSVPVGLRNVAAVREKLKECGIPILAEQVGGTCGRTVIFDLLSGQVEIRKLNQTSEWF
jgi:chemotaxis protein CheD